MSLASLLASQPTATIVNVNDETVVDGLLGVGETVVATDVRLWITDRDPADVELDEAGTPQISAYATVGDQVATVDVGYQIRVGDVRVYVVTGLPVTGRTPRGVHHRRYPCRRIV